MTRLIILLQLVQISREITVMETHILQVRILHAKQTIKKYIKGY